MPANVAGKKTATIKRHDGKMLAIIIEDTPPEYNTAKLLKRIGHNDTQQVTALASTACESNRTQNTIPL
jgi:hypothetical protein